MQFERQRQVQLVVGDQAGAVGGCEGQKSAVSQHLAQSLPERFLRMGPRLARQQAGVEAEDQREHAGGDQAGDPESGEQQKRAEDRAEDGSHLPGDGEHRE